MLILTLMFVAHAGDRPWWIRDIPIEEQIRSCPTGDKVQRDVVLPSEELPNEASAHEQQRARLSFDDKEAWGALGVTLAVKLAKTADEAFGVPGEARVRRDTLVDQVYCDSDSAYALVVNGTRESILAGRRKVWCDVRPRFDALYGGDPADDWIVHADAQRAPLQAVDWWMGVLAGRLEDGIHEVWAPDCSLPRDVPAQVQQPAEPLKEIDGKRIFGRGKR